MQITADQRDKTGPNLHEEMWDRTVGTSVRLITHAHVNILEVSLNSSKTNQQRRTRRSGPVVLLLVSVAVIALAFVPMLREAAVVFWIAGLALMVVALLMSRNTGRRQDHVVPAIAIALTAAVTAAGVVRAVNHAGTGDEVFALEESSQPASVLPVRSFTPDLSRLFAVEGVERVGASVRG